MKNVICLILTCIALLVRAQFSDDFSDQEFYNNPSWQGHVDSFEVQGQSLHLNAPANTSESFLSTASSGSVNGSWEFVVQMDFNPSSSNLAKVYLMSDTNDFQLPLIAYYVLLGNSSDEVSLYKQIGSNKTKLIDGQDGLLSNSNNRVKVKVDRDAVGNFSLYVDTSQNFSTYLLQGSVFDNEIMTSNYFGVLCDYTATRSDKFWFDDFEVNTSIYLDQFPPQVLAWEMIDINAVSLVFNEALDSTFAAQVTNYIVNTTLNPSSVELAGQTLNLYFNQDFQNNVAYNLQVLMEDVHGNLLDSTFQIILKNNHPFQTIIFNEIYADETPSYGMPSYEFLELKNTSGDTVFLEDWSLADAADTIALPLDTILPFGFLLLSKTSAVNSYLAYGPCLGVPNFPSLNNTGDQLILFNGYGRIVDSLTYHSSWYDNQTDSWGNEKKDGGFSLERIAINTLCLEAYNWYTSLDSLGASPGAENSIVNYSFPSLPIEVIDVVIDNDTSLIVHLNHQAPFLNEQNISVVGVGIEQAFSFDHQEFFVLLDQALQSGNGYLLTFSNVVDCRGQAVQDFSFEFYLFEDPGKDDLVINEVLFNPRTGGSDYIELYNKSDKLINLQGFQLLEYDVFDPATVIDEATIGAIIIQAHDYVVLSEDTADIFKNYIVAHPAHLYQVPIPNFNDDQSIITLNLPDGSLIDSLAYHKSWHLELLDIQDGVALERIDVNASSNHADNWQSAASTYGYGTPTVRNSQFFEIDTMAKLSVEPEVFNPNEDGYKDFCIIQYKDGREGELANITIFNLLGQEVKLLAQNHSLGQENIWKWNGSNNNFEKAAIGIYIVLFEIFDLDGKKQIFKEKVVLGTPLN